jgi:hypothetical protein
LFVFVLAKVSSTEVQTETPHELGAMWLDILGCFGPSGVQGTRDEAPPDQSAGEGAARLAPVGGSR